MFVRVSVSFHSIFQSLYGWRQDLCHNWRNADWHSSYYPLNISRPLCTMKICIREGLKISTDIWVLLVLRTTTYLRTAWIGFMLDTFGMQHLTNIVCLRVALNRAGLRPNQPQRLDSWFNLSGQIYYSLICPMHSVSQTSIYSCTASQYYGIIHWARSTVGLFTISPVQLLM